MRILRNGIQIALSMCLLLLTVGSMHSQDKSKRDNWTWINADGPIKIEVKVENRVEFNEAYTDVASIPDDGALRIYDSRGPRTYSLVVTGTPTGELRRTYTVNNQQHSFDAEGQSWLRRVLLQAVREGGLDATNRVARILKSRGTRGLIEEMSYIKGDYVRRIYFEALLQAPGVTDQELKSALQNASLTIKGDYERAQLLVQVAKVFLSKDDLVPGYFEAANKIESSYERARVLTAALARDELSKEALAALAQSAAKIDSDYEKASLLIKAAERYQASLSLRLEWLHAVRTIGSDYEHHRALSGALKPNQISVEALMDLVKSAALIQSDYEKASFLIEAINHYRADPRLRAAFMETARTINSEYERGRVQKRFDQAEF